MATDGTDRPATEEAIRDLRRARDGGLGEEGRTKEEQDRAMTPDRERGVLDGPAVEPLRPAGPSAEPETAA